ncbi:hypothetical protein XH87_10865 [Bradyrhizobium sp. CCBAU 53415]|nr:hypothetical protein [Bradyrhizobium sp. CCBAU 53415]
MLSFLEPMYPAQEMKHFLLVTWSVVAPSAAAPTFAADLAGKSLCDKPVAPAIRDQLAKKSPKVGH